MSVELVTVKLGSDQERIRLGQLKEFSFGIDVECCADGRAQVRDPEVGTSVKRFVGFLNYHQLEGRVGFGRFAAYEIADEDHARHAELRHFFGEALELAFEHASALAAKAEHHRGHGVILCGAEYVSAKANRQVSSNRKQQKRGGWQHRDRLRLPIRVMPPAGRCLDQDQEHPIFLTPWH